MSIRARVNEKTRNVTVSGVNYQDFRSILTSATLYLSERISSLQSVKKRTEEQEEFLAYYRQQYKLLVYLSDSLLQGIVNTHPKPESRPLTKADRLQISRDVKKQRLWLDDFIKKASGISFPEKVEA